MDLARQFKCWADIPSDEDLPGWELFPYMNGGSLHGIAAIHGTEIHFALRPEVRKKTITRRSARQFLAPLLAKRGYLTTRVLLDGNCANDDFVKRMGFELTNSDGLARYYMLCTLPFEKGAVSCQWQ